MNFRYPKVEKLKSKKLIEKLFVEGKSVSKFPLKLFYLPILFEEDIKIKTAVSVSKRNFKTAPKRNHVKRLLRETYRLNKYLVTENINGQYAFIFLYLSKDKPVFHALEKKMQHLLNDFVKQINPLKSDESN
jgi:ribonuclease P protein component